MSGYTYEEVEAWIRRQRDVWPYDSHAENWEYAKWDVLDDLLEDLRLHHATGTPLSEEAEEGPYAAGR
jgi:hypothetical protein